MTASVVEVRHRTGIAGALPVVGPLVLLSALGWVSLAMSPWLMAYPLLLIALNPRMLFLLVVAPRVGLLEFTLIATARLCVADPFSYLLGVRYGGKVRGRLEGSRLRAWLLRVAPVERTACAGAIWLRPNQTVLAWAGSLRLSPIYVAAADVATTVAYVVLIHRGMSLF
ncbi:MAG: hypothetical protein ACR2PK_15600 [Acidimicrobiales bacterium]